ncbi:MAG: FkbM family methyltransferase [Cyanobacteria bacterium P01_H01_bin.130]
MDFAQHFGDVIWHLGLHRVRTIVHVGAHCAQELAGYQAVGPEWVIWIEADPRMFARLQQLVEENARDGVHHVCINALVAEKDGEVRDFFVAENDGESSSMLRPTEFGASLGAGLTGEVLSLESRRLDSILRSLGMDADGPNGVDVLALDVQGAELLCLQGAGDFLRSVKLLFLEVTKVAVDGQRLGDRAIYQGGVEFEALDQWLRARGFVRRSHVPDRAWHGDCIYQNMGAEGWSRGGGRVVF